ncbi:unnamed protein product, partial [Peniophora sp. CBMAI 1063]
SGNVIGTEIFQIKDAPGYIPGKVTILVLFIAQFVVSFILRAINIRRNERKAQEVQIEKERRGWSDADVKRGRERCAFLDMTDRE